ncbi:MAG: LysM peptidoglycan-binding domain-containing protein [Anaerolineae bacterium]|nr:LysM peptidoglycan-binding domain-containing protein [Anaerolineae bacterium]
MNKHLIFLAAQIALCLLLASCATELADDSATLTPSLPHSHTPTPPEPPPTLRPSPLAPRPSPSPTNPPAAGSTFVEHTVQPGDTLLNLATAYDVPMAAIQLQNGMGDSTVVQVGQALIIPPRAGWEGVSRFWVVHVVKAGETLVGIARTYGLKAAELKAVNGLTDADLIVIGQELVLPLDAPAVARAPAPTHTPLHTPTPPHPSTATPAPSLTSEPPAASPTAIPAVPPPADIAAWPHETVRLINEVRAAYGLGPLAYNETLALAAQGQANDCAQRGWCSHTGSDGSNIKTRILRAGYDPASWAECWAQRQTPQGAVDIWMDEVPPNDPHRRTLLTTWLSEIGMGVAQTTWGYYFIADFGRPRTAAP